ncbi:hypothetical protein WME90_42745 [Sorangium sp. So ce375]|uniref:hypothetical protein n=1 Tax=Sorangium sp. So ce375 TaxID=3133306 RepID=UPI003F5B34BB
MGTPTTEQSQLVGRCIVDGLNPVREFTYRGEFLGCKYHLMFPIAPTRRDLPVLSPTPERLASHANVADYLSGREIGSSVEDETHFCSYVQVAERNNCHEPSGSGATYPAASYDVKSRRGAISWHTWKIIP